MILKIQKTERFTILSNDMLRNDKLSWEARGMLSFILSFPTDWKLNVSHLVKSGGISEDGRRMCGKEKVYRILNELKAAGYITGQPKRNGGSFHGFDYIVHEEPVKNVDNLVDNSESPLPENQPEIGGEMAALPYPVNPPQMGGDMAALPDTGLPRPANADAYKVLNYNKYSSSDEPKKPRGKGKSDGIVTEIQTLFVAMGSKYYHNGKEASACTRLKERFLADKKRFAQMIITYRGMRNTDKFFADQPFSPAALDTFWNKISVQWEKISVQFEKSRSDKPKMPTDEEVIADMKKEMDERNWPYDARLDSLVREAYSDMLHDEELRAAGLK